MTVVSISKTRETPMASGLSHVATSLLALDASGLSVVVTPVRPEWALLWGACSDATGGGAEGAGSAGAEATGVA